MLFRIAGVQYMRDLPERFVESNTDNLWLRYLNDMCIQGTWSDALIVQEVADALNVVIHIVESNPVFSRITTVYPVQERNSLSTITIGHIDECHYVSTTSLQSNASISMYNKSTPDIPTLINKHFLMSISGGRERLYCFPLFAHYRLITTSVTSHSNEAKLRSAWSV